MTKPTEYTSLDMKTLNKSRIRSSIFLARSHIKSNSDSKSDDITTLQTPICLAKYVPKPTTKLSPHLTPLLSPLLLTFFCVCGLSLYFLLLVINIVAYSELHAPKPKLLPIGTLVYPDTLDVKGFLQVTR